MTLGITAVILRRMTKRTAISLPDRLYRDIERARERAGLDRSTWIQEAAGEYLRKHDEAAKIEAYFDGYRRIPDTDEDSRALAKAGIEALRSLDGPPEVTAHAEADRARRGLVGRRGQAPPRRRRLTR